VDVFGRSQDPRRARARILDTAEGVLIALRGFTLNQAFVEIVLLKTRRPRMGKTWRSTPRA
jgi:hypothetical protein